MYIALVATSGSGKTTLAQKTARVLNYEYEMKSASTAPFFHPKCSFWYRIGWLLYGWMYFDRDIVRMYMRFTGVRDWYRQRGIQDKQVAYLEKKYKSVTLLSTETDDGKKRKLYFASND